MTLTRRTLNLDPTRFTTESLVLHAKRLRLLIALAAWDEEKALERGMEDEASRCRTAHMAAKDAYKAVT